MVALVSLRDIYAGEELFSSYFTIVEGEKNNTSGQSGQNWSFPVRIMMELEISVFWHSSGNCNR